MTADVHEHPWETPLEEGYWHALLTQEEEPPPAPEVRDFDNDMEALVSREATGEAVYAGDSEFYGYSSDGDFKDPRDDVWDWLSDLHRNCEVVRVTVVGCNKGGLLVRVGSSIGFVPASQLANVPECLGTDDLRDELERMVGQEIQVKLIELDRSRNRIIGSERATAWSEDDIHARLESLELGQRVRGSVRSLCEFGAFVDLGGIDGLIHISELSWERVEHPQDVLEVGQDVEVRVINVDPDQRRVGLSLKQLQPDPWMLVSEHYVIGDRIDVVITNVVDFGAFARVPEGVEGLIHISELAEGHFLHPRNVVQEGDRVTARILNIDPVNRRLGLSLRHV